MLMTSLMMSLTRVLVAVASVAVSQVEAVPFISTSSFVPWQRPFSTWLSAALTATGASTGVIKVATDTKAISAFLNFLIIIFLPFIT
jgi:hypothetical protein